VTDTPGTAAVADLDVHDDRSIHNQVGRPTSCSWPGDGEDRITGSGK